MKVIAPVILTAAMLSTSSVPENDYAEWQAGTTYALGARVIRAAVHKVFESVVAGNVGADPAVNTVKWVAVGPTNRWKMFDQAVGTSTVAVGSITTRLTPGSVNTLAVIDTDAETVRVTMTVDGVMLYDQTKTTNAGGGVITDWAAYFLADVGKVQALIFLDLPQYPQCSVEVTITGADVAGTVSVGTLLVGTLADLGVSEAGAQIGIIDFSRKETDAFGTTTVVERAWAKRMTIRSRVPSNAVDGIQRRLATLRTRPALWVGEEGYDSLTVYGFFKEFSIDLAVPPWSYCSLTIEGLI